MQPIKGFIKIEACFTKNATATQHQLIAVDTIKRVKQRNDGLLILELVVGNNSYETTVREPYKSLFMKLVIATGSPVLPGY